MKFLTSILLGVLLSAGIVLSLPLSQEVDYSSFTGQTISKILVIGNDHTKDHVILREMKTEVGDPFDPERIETDRKRIQNLLLFTRVEIYPARADENNVALVVLVAERWHFFPYPVLFRNERSWDKWSYGAGFIHNNLRGLNNKFFAELWFGYNPGGMFSYTNPWFGGDAHFYWKILAYSRTIKSRTLEYSPRFDEFHRGLSLTFGKRWGYHTYATVAASYDYLRYPENYKHLLPSSSRAQHVPEVGAAFRYDTRDLYEYPRSGWYVDVYVTQTYYPDQLNFQLYGTDVRRYVSLWGDVSLALRFALDLTHGDIPLFARHYLGYKERVRGRFYDQREGENRALFSTELRFPILPVRYINLPSGSSIFGQYSTDLPFGVSGGLFLDAGDVWYNESGTTMENRLIGWGAGLHFHIPYADILRVEYAFDTDWNSQYIVDIQVAF